MIFEVARPSGFFCTGRELQKPNFDPNWDKNANLRGGEGLRVSQVFPQALLAGFSFRAGEHTASAVHQSSRLRNDALRNEGLTWEHFLSDETLGPSKSLISYEGTFLRR